MKSNNQHDKNSASKKAPSHKRPTVRAPKKSGPSAKKVSNTPIDLVGVTTDPSKNSKSSSKKVSRKRPTITFDSHRKLEKKINRSGKTDEALTDLYSKKAFVGKSRSDSDDIVINIDFTAISKVLSQLKSIAGKAIAKIAVAIKSTKIRVPSNFTKVFSPKLIGMVSVLVVVAIGIFSLASKDSPVNNEVAQDQGSVAGVNDLSIPKVSSTDFPILYPDGNARVGELAIVSPPETDKTYAYTDEISGVIVQVSQQQLPQRLQTDQDKELRDIALAFAANEEIKSDDYHAFVGTSVEGPQSLVMIKEDLLVLIKSQSVIDKDDWQKYIKSLKS